MFTVLSIAAFSGSLFPTAARANDVGVSDLLGTWKLVDSANAEAARAEAVEASVSEMPFYMRAIARHRLRGPTQLPDRVVVLQNPASEVAIWLTAADGTVDNALYLPLNGEPRPYEKLGNALQVDLQSACAGLNRRFAGDDGVRSEILEASDRTARLTVKIAASVLPKPIQFTVPLVREVSP